MILPVYVYGQPVLRKVAENITKDYKGLEQLISDMKETMLRAEGIGLAAPQVGFPIRLFVIDADPLKEDFPELEGFRKVFINAQIVEEFGDDVVEQEGCLSVPGIREDVKRPDGIRIKYVITSYSIHYTKLYECYHQQV